MFQSQKNKHAARHVLKNPRVLEMDIQDIIQDIRQLALVCVVMDNASKFLFGFPMISKEAV